MNNKLITDAYYGTGGFADGSYLIKHPRETERKYEQRKRLAYYINHVAVAVNSQVDPIFKDEVKREWKESVLFETFKTDVDRAGTDLQELAKRTALKAKLYGYTFLLVDNTAEQAETVGEAAERRQLPYVIEIAPDEVNKCVFDTVGRLVLFEYYEKNIDAKGSESRTRCTWTQTTWERETEGKTVQGKHNLGIVPVVIWTTTPISQGNLPASEFNSIVQCNYSIYQKCSWLDEILANQAFSILVYQGQMKTELTIGTENALTYPDGANPPAFITPPATPAQLIQEQINQLVSEIYRMANLSTITGVRQATSGIAKAWDFQRANQALVDYAYMCQRAEMRLVEVYQAWTGERLDYRCEYPRDFAIADITDELDDAQRMFDLSLKSATLTVETVKRLLSVYLPNIDDDTYDQIIREIEKAADDKVQDMEYGKLADEVYRQKLQKLTEQEDEIKQ